jgi:hypothetical protein
MNLYLRLGAFTAACIPTAAAAMAQTAMPFVLYPEEVRPDSDSPATLTTGQVATVRRVLVPYKPAALTLDDAKAIKRALRDAGIRPGPELHIAITDAGVSPDQLEVLDARATQPLPAEPPSHPQVRHRNNYSETTRQLAPSL